MKSDTGIRSQGRSLSADAEPRSPDELVAELYPLLRKMAANQLQSMGPLTLAPTEFVNELFLKFQGAASPVELSKTHFRSLAARMIRQIIFDHLRHRNRQKRGGALQRVDLTISDLADLCGSQVDALALHECLVELEGIDPKAVEIVDLKLFGGLTEAEISTTAGVSAATVSRKWSMAKGFLVSRLAE